MSHTMHPAPMLTLSGAQILTDDGLQHGDLSIADGLIASAPVGRQIDLSGCLVLPGLVDLHGDGFERHMAPRRGALKEAESGVIAAAAEMAANGITTGVMAQFVSWEGGMRGPEFANHVFGLVHQLAPVLDTDLHLQLRLETHLLSAYDQVRAAVAAYGIRYVVFNDHLQHDRLAVGRRPKQLTGQALKAGRNPDDHFAMLVGLHQNAALVPGALAALSADLQAAGVRMGSHDDQSAADRQTWHGLGATICEFPETLAAAQAARDLGNSIILGSPNVVRGSSHKGNVSAQDLIAMGLCDALASDYHYPALRAAVERIVENGLLPFDQAWRLVSTGPAQVLGLSDRGRIAPGLRADLVVLDAQTRQMVATIAGGRITYLTGPMGQRFLA